MTAWPVDLPGINHPWPAVSRGSVGLRVGMTTQLFLRQIGLRHKCCVTMNLFRQMKRELEDAIIRMARIEGMLYVLVIGNVVLLAMAVVAWIKVMFF
jgi:hypothetical protein